MGQRDGSWARPCSMDTRSAYAVWCVTCVEGFALRRNTRPRRAAVCLSVARTRKRRRHLGGPRDWAGEIRLEYRRGHAPGVWFQPVVRDEHSDRLRACQRWRASECRECIKAVESNEEPTNSGVSHNLRLWREAACSIRLSVPRQAKRGTREARGECDTARSVVRCVWRGRARAYQPGCWSFCSRVS